MITKDNILFGIVGLLAGLIIGFLVTNSINQGAAKPNAPTMASGMQANSNMPPDHPNIGAMQQQPKTLNQAAVDKANAEPANFDAQFGAAEAYYSVQQFDNAIEFLLKANKIKPDDYETLVNLGNAFYDTGKFPEAEKWYSLALKQKPESSDVRTDLGLTYMLRQPADFDRSIEEFSTVLKNDPRHQPATQNLIIAYIRKGDAAKAKEYLAKLQEIAPTNKAIADLSKEIEKIGTK